jgi:hypothetical protein
MSITLTVRDETAAGQCFHELPLEFPSERITVRELIRERVYQEVQDFNQRPGERIFRGLVQPTEAEQVLNGDRTEYQLKNHRPIEWKSQYEMAIDAFEKRGFLVLVNDTQAEALEQEFVIGPGAEVSFVKLTMLVGG